METFCKPGDLPLNVCQVVLWRKKCCQRWATASWAPSIGFYLCFFAKNTSKGLEKMVIISSWSQRCADIGHEKYLITVSIHIHAQRNWDMTLIPLLELSWRWRPQPMENEAPGVYSFTTILSENRPEATGEIFVFIVKYLVTSWGIMTIWYYFDNLVWRIWERTCVITHTNPGGGFSQYHWCFRFYGVPSSHFRPIFSKVGALPDCLGWWVHPCSPSDRDGGPLASVVEAFQSIFVQPFFENEFHRMKLEFGCHVWILQHPSCITHLHQPGFLIISYPTGR